jgi:hypothetical protein
MFSGRYTLVPALLLVVCAAVLLDQAIREPRSPISAVAGSIATVWLLGVIAANYLIAPLPNGPSWESSIDNARLLCESNPNASIAVEIAPRKSWTVNLSCEEL